MKALIVISKFPPEYSGPGVRLPKLYGAIAGELGITRSDVLCNGVEYTENADYPYKQFHVHRRVCGYIRNRRFPFGFLPKALFDFIIHGAETIQGLWHLLFFKADYLHILGTSGITTAALIKARLFNIPVLMELVTAKAEPAQKFLGLKIKPPRNCTIIAMSKNAVEKCEQAGFSAQAWYRPNPIDENIFYPDFAQRNDLRAKLTPFLPEDTVISTVAKIIPQKNQIFLLDALRLLPDNFKLVIAGPRVESGPFYERDRAYADRIQDGIKSYGLESRVYFFPQYVDSISYMRASDIYALPAYDEGFGTPMLEATACGLAVIANRGEASFREWVLDGQNGFTAPLDAESWKKCLLKASAFTEEQKLRESAKVRSLAGQKAIYQAYADKIKKLVNRT